MYSDTKPHANEELDKAGFGWVGDPECDRPGTLEQIFTERRTDVKFVVGRCDEEASYSYDDTCVCKLDDSYYILNTSGCSCPSPNETWSVIYGPVSSLAECASILEKDSKIYLPDNVRNGLIADLKAL